MRARAGSIQAARDLGDVLEVSERVAHEIDAVERRLRLQAGARIAFEKGDIQAKGIGSLAGNLEKIRRLIGAADTAKSSLRKLEGVTALAATQVQNPVMRRKPGRLDQDIDFGFGDGSVFDDISVGHQIEGAEAEHRAPPVGRNLAREFGRVSDRL